MERKEHSAARAQLGIPADRLALQTGPNHYRSFCPNHSEIKTALHIPKHNHIHETFSFPDPHPPEKKTKHSATYHVRETLNPTLKKGVRTNTHLFQVTHFLSCPVKKNTLYISRACPPFSRYSRHK